MSGAKKHGKLSGATPLLNQATHGLIRVRGTRYQ